MDYSWGGTDIDCAMLVKIYGEAPEPEKRYSPAQCIGCKPHAIVGEPDPDYISTSFVERQNLPARMGLRRYARLTNAFGRKLENHAAAVALYYFSYNFVKISRALRVTPAMAAGVTDRLWDVSDLVALLESRRAGIRRSGVRQGYNNVVSPRFAIVKPCQKRWSDLHGDGRERHCDACQTSVHAIEEYSQDEWAQVWHDSHGRVCGLLCEESPSAPRSRRAVLVGALLTAISPLMAQAGRVLIRVTDTRGEPLTTAQASLLGTDDKPTRTEQANDRGEVAFTDLPLGDRRFAVVTLGFNTQRLTVTLRNGNEVVIETTLQVGTVGTVTLTTVPPTTPGTKSAKRRWWMIFR